MPEPPQRPVLPEWPALVAVGIWASLAAVSGGSLATVAAPALLAVALASTALALGALELARGRPLRELVAVRPRDVALAAYGLGGYHALLFLAFERAPLIEANLLNDAWPLLTVLLAAPMSGEKLTVRLVAAALVGLAGSVLIVGGGAPAPQGGAALGYVLAGGAAVAWSTFTNLLKRFPLGPRELAWGAGLSAALAAVVCVAGSVAWPKGGALASAVYLGVLPIGLATLLWEAGVRRGRVAVVGTLAYLAPLLSTLVVWLFLGRPLTLWTAAGGALIVAAAVLGTWRGRVDDTEGGLSNGVELDRD